MWENFCCREEEALIAFEVLYMFTYTFILSYLHRVIAFMLILIATIHCQIKINKNVIMYVKNSK